MADGFRDLIKDRIADAYFGGMGKVMMRKTHERLNWICQHVEGDTVWDIGCSQGITSILLGREGYCVYAIDVDSQAIGDARDLLEKEQEHVSSRVVFEQANCLSYSPPQKVDTVILGEVLEHFNHPDKVIDAAASALKSEGNLIITTPFGINDFFDHKQTFYIHKPLSYLTERFQVVDIEVLGKWVGFVARKMKASELDAESHLGVFEILESGFYKIERELVEKLEAEHKQQTDLSAQLTEKGQQISELKRKEQVYRVSIERLEKELRNARERYSDLESKVSSSRWLFAQTADKVVHAPRDTSRRLRRSINKRLPRAIDTRASAKTNVGTQGPRLADPHYRKYVSSYLVLRLAPILPKRVVKRLRRRMEKNLDLQADQIRPRRLTTNDKLVEEVPPFIPLKSEIGERLPVCAIMDEFTEACFKYEWDLTLLTRKSWRQEIKETQPAFLFVESAWRGNSGEWAYGLVDFDKQLTKNQKAAAELQKVLSFCRKNNIPTVFWNKEDPPNFDVFKSIALHFDYVFTTAAECIPVYRQMCKHDRVYALPFAAQPVLHNPAGHREVGSGSVVFAGSWYAHKHDARRHYLKNMLDGAIRAPLDLIIFDRHYGIEFKGKNYQFPEEYDSCVRPRLTYEQMLTAYRRYPVHLNVNSVTESPTMFSRRVFELLACGANIVSNPSAGMTEMLPGLVEVVSDAEETERALRKLFDDPAVARRQAHLGYRQVMLEHTYARRADEVVRRVRPDIAPPSSEHPVSVVIITNRPDNLEQAIENFRRQNYKNKELILALNSDDFGRKRVAALTDDLSDVTILEIPEHQNIGACLNRAIQAVNGRYWAKFDDDDMYGENYLTDMLLPFSYTDAAVIGKGTYYTRLAGENGLYLRKMSRSHAYVKLVSGATLVVDRDKTKNIRFIEEAHRGEDTQFLRDISLEGMKIYSADQFNFIMDRDFEKGAHTWDVRRDDYLKNCETVGNISDIDMVFF